MPWLKMYIQPTQQKPLQSAGIVSPVKSITGGGLLVYVLMYGCIGWAWDGVVAVLRGVLRFAVSPPAKTTREERTVVPGGTRGAR